MTFSPSAQRCTSVYALAFALVTTVWTDQFTSFDHAKLFALGLVLIAITGALIFRPLSNAALPVSGILLIGAVILLSLVHSPGSNAIQLQALSFHATRTMLVIVAAMLFLADTNADTRAARVQALILAATIPVMLLAWIQYFGVAPRLFPVNPEYTQPIYSVFGNQNLLGGFIALGIPLATARQLRAETRSLWLWGYLALALATLLLSGSRTAWLAALIGTMAVLPLRKPNRPITILAALTLGIALLMMAVTPESTWHRVQQSFSSSDSGWHLRLWIWTAAITLIQSHGLLGIGPGQFPIRSPEALGDVLLRPGGELYHSNTIHTWFAHSTPLDLLLDYGLAGGIVCVAWIAALVRHRDSRLFGAAVAFTIYAIFNSITASIPHSIAGLMLFFSFERVWLYSTNDERQASQRFAVAIPTLFLVSVALTRLLPDHQLASARALYTEQGNSAAVQQAYVATARSTFALPETHLERGTLLLDDDPESALRALQLAGRGLDTGEFHLMMSYALESNGNPHEALQHAHKATHRWPRDAAAWQQRLNLEGNNAHAVWQFEAKRWLNAEEWGRLGEELKLFNRQHATDG